MTFVLTWILTGAAFAAGWACREMLRPTREMVLCDILSDEHLILSDAERKALLHVLEET